MQPSSHWRIARESPASFSPASLLINQAFTFCHGITGALCHASRPCGVGRGGASRTGARTTDESRPHEIHQPGTGARHMSYEYFDLWSLPDDVLASALDAATHANAADSAVAAGISQPFAAGPGKATAASASTSSSAAGPASCSSVTDTARGAGSASGSLSGWGSLRPPSQRDIKGRGGSTKGLTPPPPPLSYLVVLDFEWTADNRSKMLPCCEITQFPSVLVRCDGRRSQIVAEFDTFVRPIFNPTLTAFSKALTAITQDDVDAAPPLEIAMSRYLDWLRSHGLVDAEGRKSAGSPPWCLVTWSDADIGGQLATECRHKGIAVPPCFADWIDLKLEYKRHFKFDPKGGLKACVERLGLTFEGRAHNGLVDSQNTAKICVHMLRGEGQYGPAFIFRRPTRGLDAHGHAFGSKASRAAREQHGGSARAAPSAALRTAATTDDAEPHLLKRQRG